MTLSGLGRELTLVPAFFSLLLAFSILGVADSLRLPTSMALFVREGEYFEAEPPPGAGAARADG